MLPKFPQSLKFLKGGVGLKEKDGAWAVAD